MKVADFSSAHWRKSSRSGGESGQCVGVAKASPLIGVRDSKDPEGWHIAMERAAFDDLLAKVKVGDLDL